MINELTPEQEGKFDFYVNKWIDIGCSTDEINVEAALAALKQAYEQVNLTFPEKYEIYDTPADAIKAMKDKYDVSVGVGDFMYGCHDAAWLGFYDFFLNETEIDGIDSIKPLIELALHSCWILPFDEMVVLTKKPEKISFDDENRAHCEDDYAIKFRNGDGIAIWHGNPIPSEWIFDKSTITADVALHWENVEQRRCACEILGWANVLEMLKSVTIDTDVDPTIGKLVEVEIPDVGKEKFLIVLDPNVGKQVGLPVPSEMTTALEANSWTFGIEPVDFKPEFQV